MLHCLASAKQHEPGEVPLASRQEAASTQLKHEWRQLIEEMTDLRKPFLWYPLARQMAPRRLVLHVGPTNSGKTYSAIEDLAHASSGVYCGPLRLLAQEIYQKLTERGVKCDMITGQKVITVEDATHVACTVEMASLKNPVDVAVIDEYQLIGDASRGWAWTRALLGIPARTIHLCGDASALSLLEKIAKETGDELEIKRYERLSPLKPLRAALERPVYDGLQPGDCIVTFSKKELYKMKYLVEKNTEFQCCVVYGDLPPDTRAEQAALFNDPKSGFNILIATDAIGLGLNLNIRRIVFSTVEKFDGESMRELTVSEIKQIAGRAGRFKSLYPVGEVTAFDDDALRLVRRALKIEIGPANPHLLTEEAGVLPMFEQLESLHAVMGEGATFSDVLDTFEELAQTDKHYFLCKGDSLRQTAQLIQHLPLSLQDLYTFCMAPVDIANELVAGFMVRWAESYARGLPIPSPTFGQLMKAAKSKISAYETAFKVVDLYLWLSYRFPTFFSDRTLAEQSKDKIAQTITNLLLYQVETSSEHIVQRVRRLKDDKKPRHGRHSAIRRGGDSTSLEPEDDDDVFTHKQHRSKRAKHFKFGRR